MSQSFFSGGWGMAERLNFHPPELLDELGCLELLNAPGGFRQEQLEQLSSLACGLAERLMANTL